MTPRTAVVVPCYNEAARFPADAFRAFAMEQPSIRFVFVNDGSTDSTGALIRQLAAEAPDRFEQLDLRANGGKAEAVRAGVLRAIDLDVRYVGYWDADLATPLREIVRFIETLEAHPDRLACFGARVQLLGRRIERLPHRHYIGRLFATIASMALDLPVYDTQCGAKLFRIDGALRDLFAEPFLGRWSFDIELIARLERRRLLHGARGAAQIIYELPLDHWREVAGSKVSAFDFLRSVVEVLRIRRKYLTPSSVRASAAVPTAAGLHRID